MNDNRISLKELSFTNSRFEIIKNCEVGQAGDVCEIISPNWPFEGFNNGFSALNTVNDCYFQIVEKLNNEESKISDDFYEMIYDYDSFFENFKLL